jgi:hypothetical protein
MNEQTLTKRETILRVAVLNQDKDTLYTLLTDDFRGIGFAGQFVDRDFYITIHTNPAAPFTHFTTEQQQVKIVGDIGYVIGVQDVTAERSLKSRYVGIYIRQAEQWHLQYWQETSIVDPTIFDT